MRGQAAWGVALRHPDGTIVSDSASFAAPSGWKTLPILRGLYILGSTFKFGFGQMTTALQVSTFGGRRESSRLERSLPVIIGILLALVIFVAAPLLATGRESNDVGLLQRLAEGVLKFLLFAGYVFLITRISRIGRIWSYHGAEHMSIHCLEAGDALTVENVEKYSPAHPRCGTAFLVILFALDTIALAALPRFGLAPDLFLRIAGLPLLGGIGYEVLRFGASHGGVLSVLNKIGLLTQKLTTSQPDRDQIEVAIAALEAALRAEGQPLPAGSTQIQTRPIPKAEETAVAHASSSV